MRHQTAAILGVSAILSISVAEAQTLPDAMVMAYQDAPELVGETARIRINLERVEQAKAGGRPIFTGVLGAIAVWQERDRSRFPLEARLDLTQPLFTGGQVANAVRASRARVGQAISVARTTEQRILLAAVDAYVSVRLDRARVRLAGNNVKVIASNLRTVTAQRAEGLVTKTDLAQVQARHHLARANLARAEGQLDRSTAAYRRAIGVMPGRLAPLPPLPEIPESLEAAIELAAVNHPSVKAARLARVAAGAEVRAAMGALLPRVELRASGGYFDPVEANHRPKANATIGLNLTIPIYGDVLDYSAVREAQAAAEARAAEIGRALREVALETATAWTAIATPKARARFLTVQIVAAEVAVAAVKEEAVLGQRTPLDVLNAERELLQARTDLIEAEAERYLATYRLLAAIGLLTVDHLGLNTKLRYPNSR